MVVVLLALATPSFACPMCKDSTVAADKSTATASAGLDFNNSIYVMLGGFITIVGFSGRVMFKAVKSHQ